MQSYLILLERARHQFVTFATCQAHHPLEKACTYSTHSYSDTSYLGTDCCLSSNLKHRENAFGNYSSATIHSEF